MEKPQFITPSHLEILARLEEAAADNMFVAVPFILAHCPQLTLQQAQDLLQYRLAVPQEKAVA